MTPEQEAFYRDLPFFKAIEERPDGTLVVKGADGTYIFSCAGTLKPRKIDCE